MIDKKELRERYSHLAESYDDGTRFLPKVAKIEFFWELYPDGAIVTPMPQKDLTGEGIIAFCQIYSDRSDMKHTLITETFARRSAVSQSDVEENEIDVYSAVRADAISQALSLAGINISADDVLKDILKQPTKAVAAVPDELVIENGSPVEESIPEPPKADSSEETVPNAEAVADASKSKGGDNSNAPEDKGDDTPNTPANETVVEPEVSTEGDSGASDDDVPDIPDVAEPEEVAEPETVSEPKSAPEPDDIPDIGPENKTVEEPAKEEPKPKKRKTTKESPEPIKAKEEVPVKGEPEPAPAADTSKKPDTTEAALVKEYGVSYEEALNTPFRHQTRSGILKDLLADEPSKCLLKWMGKPTSVFRKTQPQVSAAAQIIAVHNSLL